MQVKNHILFDDNNSPVKQLKSPNRSGKMTPQYLVIHYTAGSSVDGSIEQMMNKDKKVSAHLAIDRLGEITQLVPFNMTAWHAGVSNWQGIKGLNKCSIGIELDNAGEMTGGPGNWKSWFKKAYDDADVLQAAHQFDGKMSGWHEYTEPQLKSAMDVSSVLTAKYGLFDILGHDDIAPGRKRDPGPAFPMNSFRSSILGRSDDVEQIFETTSSVNLRSGPGTNFEVIEGSPLKPGTYLVVEDRQSIWCSVEIRDASNNPVRTGWLHGKFIKVKPA